MDNTNSQDPQAEDALSKVTINGQEYDASEVQELMDVGRQTRDLESQYNTKLDKVWPEYGRLNTEKGRLSTELEDARAKLAQFETKQDAGVETPADEREAREAARKLGITLNEDLEKSGYIKKDDLPKYFQEYSSQQEAINKVLAEGDRLEKEINGEDGRPAFNKKQVLAYANAYGFGDLNEAYTDMYKPQLDTWKANQVSAHKDPSLKTLDAGGKKEPRPVKVTDDNVKDLLKELLPN